MSLRSARARAVIIRHLRQHTFPLKVVRGMCGPDRMDIRLSEVEDRICRLLDGCTKWLEETHGVHTSCRIAGGWVRDKVRPRSRCQLPEYFHSNLTNLTCLSQLLGLQSNDIDVALTDMMGVTFAEQFQSYLKLAQDVSIDKVAKVEKNPDRSKHLETAKAKVLGIELDFVNLRSEEYADDSRIPTQVVSIMRIFQLHLY